MSESLISLLVLFGTPQVVTLWMLTVPNHLNVKNMYRYSFSKHSLQHYTDT